MGGLFSSNEPAVQPSRPSTVYSRSSHVEPISRPVVRPSSYTQRDTAPTYRPQASAQPTRRIQELTPLKGLTPSVMQQDETLLWTNRILYRGPAFQLVTISQEDPDYQEAYAKFRGTAQRQLKIVQIKRVENPYLLGCFLLKREEMEERHGFVNEELLFHGTKNCNVNAICVNNFNWRLHGDSVGNKFGKGVSFSPIANYSSHYCDNSDNFSVNVMFLARVIISNECVGNKNMVLPQDDYDTAIKQGRQVIVKFCDSEFYPEFIIYFTGRAFSNNPHCQHKKI